MRQRSVLIVVGITAILTGEWACGYFAGAHSVPALQVTVQAPPAPDVIYSSPSGTLVATVGTCIGCGPIPESYDPHSWKLRKPQLHGIVTFTSGAAACTGPHPKPQDMKMQQVAVERIK